MGVDKSMPLNMTEFLENPWETAYSPFTDFFNTYLGVGNAFWLFLLVVFTFGIFVKTEGNGTMASMFMIASGAILGSANVFLNQPEMSLAFYIFSAIGIGGLFISVLFQR